MHTQVTSSSDAAAGAGAVGENGLLDVLHSRRQLNAATAALVASNIEGNDLDDDKDSEEKDRKRNIAIIVAAVAFAVLLAACALGAWLRMRARRRAAASYGVRIGGKPADAEVPQYAPNNKVAEYVGAYAGQAGNKQREGVG